MRLRVLALRVVQVVRGDDRQAGPTGELDELGQDLALLGQPVILELDEEVPGAEDVPVRRGHLVGLGCLTAEQQLRDLGREAPREPDQALAVLGQELLVDPGPVVEALEVRVGDQLEEVPVPGLVPSQDREVPVLLLALTRGPLEPGRGRDVGLDPHDRLDPGRDPGLVELQRPEHRTVVGERERRHPELGGPLEQRLDPRGPVQQGELGVHVEVNEAVRHDSLSPISSSGSWNLWGFNVNNTNVIP